MKEQETHIPKFKLHKKFNREIALNSLEKHYPEMDRSAKITRSNKIVRGEILKSRITI